MSCDYSWCAFHIARHHRQCMSRALLAKMRGLGAMVVLDHLLFASAFQTPPASSNMRHGNPITRSHISNTASSAAFHVSASDATTDAQDDSANRPVLSFPGGGIFFWWQAGAITALQERYDLSAVDFVGASAGALAATLAACDADMNLAMTLALELCDTNEVWSRPLGLAGVWGGIVEDWLDDLLPNDADVICRNRVHLLVLDIWPLPFERRAVSDFVSKDDVIKSCMASVHIPYFMNSEFSALHRGCRCIDGSFRASPEDLTLGADRSTVYLDYEGDEVMAKRRGQFLSLTNKEGLVYMRQRGYDHVQAMLAEGQLDCLKDVALPALRPMNDIAGKAGGGG